MYVGNVGLWSVKSQSCGIFSCEWNFCFPRRHIELLPVTFHLFISALRLLHLQKLQHVLWELPPWPALTRLLQLDGVLGSVVAQHLHLVRGKLAPGLFVPNSNHRNMGATGTQARSRLSGLEVTYGHAYIFVLGDGAQGCFKSSTSGLNE